MLKEYLKYKYYVQYFAIAISIIPLFISLIICILDNPYYGNLGIPETAMNLKIFYNNYESHKMNMLYQSFLGAFSVFFIIKLNKTNLQHLTYFILYSIWNVFAYITFFLDLNETVWMIPILSSVPDILYYKYLISDIGYVKGKRFLIGYTVFYIIGEVFRAVSVCYSCAEEKMYAWNFVFFTDCVTMLVGVFRFCICRGLYHTCKQDDTYTE